MVVFIFGKGWAAEIREAFRSARGNLRGRAGASRKFRALVATRLLPSAVRINVAPPAEYDPPSHMTDSVEKNPDSERALIPLGGAPLGEAPGTSQSSLRPGVSVLRRIPVVIQLSLLVGLTLAILLAVSLAAGWFYWRDVLRSHVDAHLSGIAASRRDLVQVQVSMLRQRVELNTDRGEFRGFFSDLSKDNDPSENRAYSLTTLQRISDGKPIRGASLADLDGTIIVATDPAGVGKKVVNVETFNAGLSGPTIGRPRWVGDRFEVILAAPVRTRSEPIRVYGVLLANADASELAAAVNDVPGLGRTGEILLGVREGANMRFLFPPRNAPETTLVPLEKAPALAASIEGAEAFFRNRDYRGVPVLSAGRPIGFGGWALVAKMDEAEAYAPAANALRLGVVYGSLLVAVGLVATYVVALGVTRPIRRLAQAASRIAGGDYGTTVPVKSGDELGVLSENFNAMAAALRTRSAERDEAERALRESEARARQIAESLPQLVWTCSADGTCDYLSPQWVVYTGIPATPQLGFGWSEQVHPDDRADVVERWKAIVASGITLDVQFRIRRHDGVYRWFLARATPLKDERGRVIKWFGTTSDIDDAQRAGETLREADRRKDEFLAMLGHELRNPLSAIANAVRLWQDATNEAAAAEFARDVISRQTGNLSRLVEDLLDVTRISEGKIELRQRPVDVGHAINRGVESVRSLIQERRHELDLTLAGGGQLLVMADPMRLEQIITNLLTNAAKYTPDGGRITVVLRHEGRDAVITVSDNGIGIAPEMLPKIFDLFAQADRSLDRTSGGLGIGLNLCHHLVALHGGTISAHSNGLGQGAAFTVRLPIADAPAPALPAAAAAPLAPAQQHRRILLVDDNQDTVRALSRLLALRGHEVATAYDGLTALEIAPKFKPDVLLLDIGLPGLDGYALASRLRAEGFTDTLMIAITGYAQEGDRARAREAGFDRHFAKPVDFEALATLLGMDPETVRGG
jgi:PAS domain S-box-containing protein